MDDIFSIIKKSPTPMHFIECSRENLVKNGFTELIENDKWEKIPNKFFVVRSDESIIACNIVDINSSLMFATNLDYPCFKVRPNSGLFKNNAELLNIQNYGHAMWFTWMDRDLSIAGKVIFNDNKSGQQFFKYIHIKTPICAIPLLASHLTPRPKETCNINIEENMRPIISFRGDEQINNDKPTQSPTLLKYLANECNCDVSDIVDFDLYVISAEEPSKIGINNDIYASQCISSILQASFAFDAFLNSKPKKGMTIFYGYSHENDMNESRVGFDSNFLRETLNRIHIPNTFYSNSLLFGGVRIPAAYTLPSYGVCYREGNKGEYQPNKLDLEKFISELNKNGISNQKCSTTYDIRCGIQELSIKLNLSAFYFGIPTYSLHSIRESAFLNDIICYYNCIKTFYQLDY